MTFDDHLLTLTNFANFDKCQYPINVNKSDLNVTIKADTFKEGLISDILSQHFSTSSVLCWTCKSDRILRTQ